MKWPRTPVDRLQEFRPPFCPRSDCRHHTESEGFRWRKHGFYATKRNPRIQRYRCTGCKSTFSRKAFSLTYYLKRPELLRPVAAGLQAGSAHGQIARSEDCASSTVTRLSARLGRHAMLLHCRSLEALEGRLDEPVVFDHFETFELTQDLPFGIGTAVGAESWFVYGVDPAPHARGGKLSPAQKRRCANRAPRPRRGGYTGSTLRTLDRLLRLKRPGRELHLITDGMKAYDRALARHPLGKSIRHERHPNPKRGPKGSKRSAEAEARDRAMFPADSLHGLLRHTLAAHKRETIAFGRRINAIVERFFVTAIWRNFVKHRSERRPDRRTPAMLLKLTDRPWPWTRVLGRRLFPARERIDAEWMRLYRRAWPTPELGVNAPHELKYAF
jgi:transposase-like protein